MSRMLRSVFGAMVLLLAAGNAWAQATAQINGTVADSSGGVLPGVTVVAIQADTGFRRETTTDAAGSFALLNLPIGPYRLEAVLSGFQNYQQTGIALQVGSNPVVRVTLQLGGVQETVSVEAAASLVETRNPAVGQVIDNEQVEQMPLEGRNPVMLVLLTGSAADVGAPPNRSMTTSRGISITGGTPFGVSYLLDGAAHNNIFDGLNLPLPFPDALQEFRVETSTQNAKNGTHAGGTVSVVTKSGTNLFHGDVFEFARHHRFNAPSPFARTDPRTGKPQSDGLVRNQFGGTLGGPIVRDQVFFFGAYQKSITDQTPADTIAFVPTAAMLAGDFTQVSSAACVTTGALTLRAPFVNNRINPALFSPAAVKIAQRLPTTSDPCGKITYARKADPREGQTIGRVDWQIGQNDSFFARFMQTTTLVKGAYENSPDNNVLTSTIGGFDNYSNSLAIGETRVLSNTAVNNLRAAIHRTPIKRKSKGYFGPQDVGVNLHHSLPDFFVIMVTGGFEVGSVGQTPGEYNSNANAISDDLTMIFGDHQIGLGTHVSFADWNANVNTYATGQFMVNGAATGLGLADFLIGDVLQYRQGAPFLLDATQRNFAVYAQDTWRVSAKATLNYGLRWEPWFPQQHQNNATYNFSIERHLAGVRSKVYPQMAAGMHYPGDEGFPSKAGIYRDWKNFQPRVGVSWDPNGDGRTSVRAGYSLNGDFVPGTILFDASQAPPFNLDLRLRRPAIGRLDDPFAGSGVSDPFPISRGADAPFQPGASYLQLRYDLKTARVHGWNVGVQREIANNMAMSATYVGNHWMHLWADTTGNPGVIPAGASATGPCTLRTVTGTQTFANCSSAPLDLRRELSQLSPANGLGYVDFISDQGWQRYHGLLLTFQRRASNGSASLNYTVSKCEGLVSQGGTPVGVGSGYSRPVSLINPPSEAEAKALYEVDKGPCDLSPRHIFSLNASAETPQFVNTTARVVASGWRLSGILTASSGSYFSAVTGSDRSLSGILNVNQRLNQTGGNPYGDGTLNNWLNASAFAQPALGTYGTSGRNAYLGPGRRNLSLSLSRLFRLGGTRVVEARVESFNALDWLQMGQPINDLSNQNFGRILTAGDPRIMQFAMKYSF